ncbi:MAG: VOC family protein [Dehalococcoidia bacterium]|nr:VOC family protein [Dehalococcoidia bacterium]
MNTNIRPNLWFDTEAEEAARFYTGVFKNSKLGAISYYPNVGQEITGKPPGSVLTVEFELNGQQFVALNGGPDFKFNESISLGIDCADQAEVDYYWDKLSNGGDPSAQQCGWLKDKYGVSWQVVPIVLYAMHNDPDEAKRERVFKAMLDMKKLDLAGLQQAFEGSMASRAN